MDFKALFQAAVAQQPVALPTEEGLSSRMGLAAWCHVLELAGVSPELSVRCFHAAVRAARSAAAVQTSSCDGLTCAEFAAALMACLPDTSSTSLPRLRLIFAFYDQDGDGAIGADEFVELISDVHESVLPLGPRQARQVAQAASLRFKVANKGRVTFDEFRAAVVDGHLDGTGRLLRLDPPGVDKLSSAGYARASVASHTRSDCASSEKESRGMKRQRAVAATTASPATGAAAAAVSEPAGPSQRGRGTAPGKGAAVQSSAATTQGGRSAVRKRHRQATTDHDVVGSGQSGAEKRARARAPSRAPSRARIAPHLLLQPDVHDVGVGDRPSRHLAIANFALSRSKTQCLLSVGRDGLGFGAGDEALGGAVSATTAAEAAEIEESAKKVIFFLLNPRAHPKACTWQDESAPAVIAMVRGAPTWVQPSRARRILAVPSTQDSTFLQALLYLIRRVSPILDREARVQRLRSPTYVFGDLHGNMEDLAWLATKVWPLGPEHTAGTFVFLGDYVDRGPNSLEVVAYLLALKLLAPTKFVLLRGNHEHRAVNSVSGARHADEKDRTEKTGKAKTTAAVAGARAQQEQEQQVLSHSPPRSEAVGAGPATGKPGANKCSGDQRSGRTGSNMDVATGSNMDVAGGGRERDNAAAKAGGASASTAPSGGCLLDVCLRRYGAEQGQQLWEQINNVFDRMPLAAVIDGHIFCCHGGVPRDPPAQQAYAWAREREQQMQQQQRQREATQNEDGTGRLQQSRACHSQLQRQPSMSLVPMETSETINSTCGNIPADDDAGLSQSQSGSDAGCSPTQPFPEPSPVARSRDGNMNEGNSTDALTSPTDRDDMVFWRRGVDESAGGGAGGDIRMAVLESLPCPLTSTLDGHFLETGAASAQGDESDSAGAVLADTAAAAESKLDADWMGKLALDVMWADPAVAEQEELLSDRGFIAADDPTLGPRIETVLRRELAAAQQVHQLTHQQQQQLVRAYHSKLTPRWLTFGRKATEDFCEANGLTHMMRGHSVKAEGLGLQAGGAVVTIFSDSMDHNVRGRCGWVLIEERVGTQQKIHLHVGGPQH